MLATSAFLTTSFLVAAFAVSIKRLLLQGASFRGYAQAYLLLSLTFFIFGIATITKHQSFLEISVLIGNFLIFAGTVLIALSRSQIKKLHILLLVLGLSTLLVIVRVLFFYPEPALREGVLFFNTPLPVGLFISSLFLFGWLPLNLAFSKNVAKTINLSEAYYIYAGLFTLATMSAIFFIASRSTFSVIITFASIAASFLSLLLINMLTVKIRRNSDGTRKSK